MVTKSVFALEVTSEESSPLTQGGRGPGMGIIPWLLVFHKVFSPCPDVSPSGSVSTLERVALILEYTHLGFDVTVLLSVSPISVVTELQQCTFWRLMEWKPMMQSH